MILVTNPTYFKSIVSFLRTFRACQVILSFDSDILEIYAKDIESIHFLKANVKIKQDRPMVCRSIKVRLEDLKEVFNNVDREVTELKMGLTPLEMLEAVITSPMRTIQVSILYQRVPPPALWEKKDFPLSWSMAQKAFKKSFSNQGQIERYIRITAAGGQIQLETNKAHHVVCKETLYTEAKAAESTEFLISLDLLKRNLTLPCKKLTISCSKELLQLSSSAITIRTVL